MSLFSSVMSRHVVFNLWITKSLITHVGRLYVPYNTPLAILTDVTHALTRLDCITIH